ncbi:hypothetical protein CKO15_06055 [Halorhodospira abdelmalekii]|uniref:hypothetical protein n=1 Tax=Halorhodospira abdelmalekii TaxID=421629 RepID=UPI001908CA51|nr:hypothetical protein [Halorhodospira abdelmalekii]MBK1734859.1 hypothetical protein [Halorhodospira abdelmalekii]
MIELSDNELVFRFPEIHSEAHLTINFQRTLRIPDDQRDYPLPPGLGRFPLFHVDDYAAELPAPWARRGGVFLPMHQAEGMWISFKGDYPFAVKVATGKINAVSGETWTETLTGEPQDYLVVPEQPWLDGYNVGHGRIRQFVATPLGQDETVEEQLTGEAAHGGIQILAYPMKAAYFEHFFGQRNQFWEGVCSAPTAMSPDMGLAAGGLMRQRIHEDPFGLACWEQATTSRCFVHILNSRHFRQVTGYATPQEPPSAELYSMAGLPWFELNDADHAALEGAPPLQQVESLKTRRVREGKPSPEDSATIHPDQIVGLDASKGRPVDSRF